MIDCPSCGALLPPEARFCSACGVEVSPPVERPESGTPRAPAGQTSLAQMPAVSAAVPKLGAPGIGIAGLVASLLGVGLLGIILSWIGYAKAKREGRPTGLCRAGIIIGFAWIVVPILYVASGL